MNFDFPDGLHIRLIKALEMGDLSEARRQLELGANPNSFDNLYSSPMGVACARGETDAIDLLIAHGADIRRFHCTSEFSIFAKDPLMLSVDSGMIESARHLLGLGVDPNATNPGGMTALHWACHSNIHWLINPLLSAGADPTMVDSDGHTALDIAKDRQAEDCILRLEPACIARIERIELEQLGGASRASPRKTSI